MIQKIIIILAVIFIGTTDLSFSHSDSVDEQGRWNPISPGPLTTWTAPVCGKGKVVIQPFLFYNRTRGAFNGEGHYDSLPSPDKKSQYQQQLFMQYGLTDRLELDGQTVYQENFRRQNNNNAHSDGLGDSYLFLRWCALEEEDNSPHIAALFQVKMPTGKYQKLDTNKLGTDSMGATSGGGSYDHGYGINVTKKVRPFMFHADAIYSFPLETKVDGIETKYGKYLNYDFSAEYFLPKGFNLMLEFNGFLQGDKRQRGTRAPNSDINYLTAVSGIGWSSKKVQALLAYQRILTGTNTDANDSVALTIVYIF